VLGILAPDGMAFALRPTGEAGRRPSLTTPDRLSSANGIPIGMAFALRPFGRGAASETPDQSFADRTPSARPSAIMS